MEYLLSLHNFFHFRELTVNETLGMVDDGKFPPVLHKLLYSPLKMHEDELPMKILVTKKNVSVNNLPANQPMQTVWMKKILHYFRLESFRGRIHICGYIKILDIQHTVQWLIDNDNRQRQMDPLHLFQFVFNDNFNEKIVKYK